MSTFEAKRRDREDHRNPTLHPTKSVRASTSHRALWLPSDGCRLAILAGGALLFLAGCNGPRITLDMSSWLDETSVVKVYARGAYVYVSRPSLDQEGVSTWHLKGIEANLYDAAGYRVGRQSSPATWEATDKSKVTGTVMSEMPSPTLSAVPWILYESRSNSTQGLFADVTHVRRIFTWGGKAPRRPSGKTVEGNEVRVPFSATYYFQRGGGLAPGGDAPQTIAGAPTLARLLPEQINSLRRLEASYVHEHHSD